MGSSRSAFSYPSEHAAIAGAASKVLAYLFPEVSPERLNALASRAAASRVSAGTNYPSDVAAGLRLGRMVGDAAIARAMGDGFDLPWEGPRPNGEKHWAPPPGTFGPPTRPMAGRWRTWILPSGDSLRPPPPPAFGSARFLAEAEELLDISRSLSSLQKGIASGWAGGEGTPLPPGIWNEIALRYVRLHPMSEPGALRLFALLNMALADAGVAAWDAKYAYWSPRPENAIHDLGLDPRWRPFLATPFFPSYVSGHATYSGAAAEVLAYVFPDATAEFRRMAREAADSRMYGGIHFRSDTEVGLLMGRSIGKLVVERAKRDGADR